MIEDIIKGFNLALSEIFSKNNFRQYYLWYYLVISFFIFIFLNMIFNIFNLVLLGYLAILIVYVMFKVIK